MCIRDRVLGIAALLGFAELTVVSASRLAEVMGVSQGAIAVIVIGMGSSLPEMSLSIMALLRKKGGLSIGNLFGSNILDTMFVPGLGAVIVPLAVDAEILWFDIPFLFFLTLVALIFMMYFRRGLQRREAAVLLSLYVIFVTIRFSEELLNGFSFF